MMEESFENWSHTNWRGFAAGQSSRYGRIKFTLGHTSSKLGVKGHQTWDRRVWGGFFAIWNSLDDLQDQDKGRRQKVNVSGLEEREELELLHRGERMQTFAVYVLCVWYQSDVLRGNHLGSPWWSSQRSEKVEDHPEGGRTWWVFSQL